MNNLSDVISCVSETRIKYSLGDELFFRGQRGKDKLLPGLLREDHDDLKEIENKLFCNSYIMGNDELKNCKNSWEQLAIMQHYGFSTRLLDWTTSLMNSIYFALSACIGCNSKCNSIKKRIPECHGNPVIWVLDPFKMHKIYYPKLDLLAFTVGIDDIQDYKDIFIKKTFDEWEYKNGPIFLEIPWNNPRIKSQKGYFTFHFNDTEINSKCAVPITINDKCRKNILNEIKTLGITEFDIYSDLVSLSRHVRQKYEIK
jgi:hypothetical protein